MGFLVIHSPSACKGRGSLDAQLEFILDTKMKVCLALCVLLCSAFAEPEAKPKPVVKCHTVYDTTYTTACKNIPERHNVPEKVCHPVTRKVPDKVCHNHPERICK